MTEPDPTAIGTIATEPTRREQDGPTLRPPLLPRERARQKLATGVPLLHGEDLDPDLPYCRQRFHTLLDAAPERLHSNSRQEIIRALQSGRLDLDRVLDEALADHPDHLAALAQAAGVPLDPLAPLAAEAVRPSLETLAAAYRPLYADSTVWRPAYCPVCGGASADQPASPHRPQPRRCSRCGAEWPAASDRDPSAPSTFRLELADEEPDELLDDLLELD
jgi:hypothetical protein